MTENCPNLQEIKHVILHSAGASENLPVVLSDSPIMRQANSDAHLLELWLHGRSRHTQRAYASDIRRFLKLVAKPLHQITLGDVQGFADQMESQGLSEASRSRKLAAIKSLFSFGQKLGYLAFDVGKPVKVPAVRDTLNERILSEVEVMRMIALENQPRNHTILLLLYAAGLRVSELCGLRWRDCCQRDAAGQISVLGKRSKTRRILLPSSVWNSIVGLKNMHDDDAPVFLSRKGRFLNPSQVWRIVKKAAARAGVNPAVSCHWLRHCHCSHALDRGANIALVQATAGHSSVAMTGRYLHARPTDSSANYLPL
jgi:integrase/recombinase XerD